MNYLIISSLALALMYGTYRLLLCRTTMHRFNRIVLLSILVLSLMLPAFRIDGVSISFPQEWADEQVSSQPVGGIGDSPLFHISNAVQEPAFSGGKGDSPQFHISDVSAQGTAVNAAKTVGAAADILNLSLRDVVTYFYIVGLVIMLVRLLVGIIRVQTLCRLGARKLKDGSRLVVCEGDFQPTSWLSTIIMSRKDFESDSSDLIIEHERAHIRNHHSIDVLFAQLVCALQWFNPAAWALKHSLQEVHEYEADAAVLADGENERQYQICLVQAALGGKIGFVTSNFADCSTKKRLKLMKRNQSSPFVCFRALLMLPVVAVIILVASACKSDAGKDASQTGPDQTVVELSTEIVPVSQVEPLDTAFLKKFGYMTDEFIQIKQLNVFVEVEWDGGIWITFDGEQTFHQATLDNFTEEFDRLKKESTVQVARPDMVFVTCANDEHLDIAQSLIKKLRNSYSDDKIILITLPGRKTVPPPPAGSSSKYHIDYNLNFEKDQWVNVSIDRKNYIDMTAHNVTRTLSSAQEINPTLESLGLPGRADSVEIQIKADNRIIIRIPEVSRRFGKTADLKKELNTLFPDAGGAVYWQLTYDTRCSARVENEVRDLFNEVPFKDNQVRIVNHYRIYKPNMTYQDSIDYIIFGKDDGDAGRKRHVKNMKWYNDNKDKDEFFRMGFVDGKLCVCKGNDPSRLQPIEFDQLVPYFKANCPDGDARKAIVLFEVVDTKGVPVTYIDQVLTKMEGWITTLTRRLYLSPKHIE